ncbi:MAG TPA: response regulator [Ramlibacter sp.]|jgi:CheY-like chemotaxis protein|nr:response regulator [Ramlibacter sp.]
MLDRSLHTILVVDDHPANRYALGKILTSAGYKVTEGCNGQEALEKAWTSSALVLDVHLPDIDGFEVCRQLRLRDPGHALPIVHVSSVHVTGFSQSRAQRLGADAYLLSPVSRDTLLGTMDKLLQTGGRKAAVAT